MDDDRQLYRRADALDPHLVAGAVGGVGLEVESFVRPTTAFELAGPRFGGGRGGV